jgi:hypothetical protein
MFPNRNSLLSVLTLVALLPGAAPATAAPPAFAYQATTLEKAAPTGRAGGNVSESRVIAVDLALLARDPDQLEVELPDGRIFPAYRTLSWTEEGDRRYWSGELRRDGNIDGLPDGFLSLSAEGEWVAGSVKVGQDSFEIVPLDRQRQRLTRAPQGTGTDAKGSHCAADTAAPAPQEGPAIGMQKDATTKEKPPGTASAVIDVLAIFPQSLGTPALLEQTRARITARFGDANQILWMSGTNAQFRVVFAAPLLGEQPPVGSPATAPTPILGLRWLQAGKPEVAGLRAAVGADYVALFVPGDHDTNCGAAEPGGFGVYAAIDLDCAPGEFLVAHELGHLLGLRHPADEYDDSPLGIPPSPFPFAFGYDANNTLQVAKGVDAATVMACNGPADTTTGNQCNRIPYFSTPNSPIGTVIGTAEADNARAARLQAPVAAEITPASSFANMPPTVTLLRPLDSNVQANQMLTLSAVAFDYEDGDRSNFIQWSSNQRGNLGTGATLRVAAQPAGTEVITAFVIDSGGLGAYRSKVIQHVPTIHTVGAIWHDPGTPGRYLSFNENDAHHWVATWMAYEGPDPVWYQSLVVPLSTANGYFEAPLYRYTRNPWTGVQDGTYVGNLSVAVETARQIRLHISAGPAGPIDLVLEPYTDAVGPGSYWSLVEYRERPEDPPVLVVDGGWMIWRGPKTGGAALEEVRILITFDGPNAVWLIGSGIRQPDSGNQLFNTAMYRPTLGAGSHNAGGLAFFTNNSNGSVSLLFQSGNTWIRTNQLMAPATVR